MVEGGSVGAATGVAVAEKRANGAWGGGRGCEERGVDEGGGGGGGLASQESETLNVMPPQ